MTPSDPTPPEPALQAAARLLAQGRPALAAERLARLVAEAPIYAAAHVLRATALEAAGRVDEAIVSWGRAAALVPRSPLVHRERERLLATRLAIEPPPDLPPAEPAPPPPAEDRAGQDEPAAAEPAAAEPAAAEPAAAEPAAGGSAREGDGTPMPGPPPPSLEPLGPYDTSQTLDPADVRFTDAPPPQEQSSPQEGSASQEPEASPDEAPSPAAPEPPAGRAEDWASVEPPHAPILAPEGETSASSSAPPPDIDSGWGVLDEVDVPTPSPGTYAEPDIVAPESAPRIPGPTVADELDALITQLEGAPRIRPDSAYRGPEQSLDAGDADELASETLAKIYATQHQYVKAALMYEKMAARRPEQADEFLERAAALRQRKA